MSQRLPLVVILGSTGSGKTKLSIDLAQKFRGEIIGADSMQIYKGLDIITAKATKVEQARAPHHLIDLLEPNETCKVVEFRNLAVKIIDSLLNKSKLPIVVGGTNYYIESLLWKILIEEPGDRTKTPPDIVTNEHELPSEELHKKLKLLDPEMARRLHPNNKRKILRSLEVLYQKGKPHSKILEEQRATKGGSRYGGGLRYSNVIIFNLQCKQDILDDRLNRRVDKMVEDGLVEELTDFHRKYNARRIVDIGSPDYTKGIFQSIGFKEFHPYLMMSDEEKNTEPGRKLLEMCIEELKLVTRRYARKQIKWTRNRFLAITDREVPPLYGLDASDPEKWDENVAGPAFNIVDCYLNNKECIFEPLSRHESASNPNAEDDTYFCQICERTFVGNYQWTEHLRSRRHKKRKTQVTKEGV